MIKTWFTRTAIAAGMLIFSGQLLYAAPITLTFEGLQDQEAVDNYYNGGLGGNGSGPGPNDGITFGADSLAVISQADGGSGDFSGNPSGDTVLFFLSGPGDVMNVAAGFSNGLAFYYSAAVAGSVSIFSGLNGTGTLLETLVLPVTPTPYTVWVPIGVDFAGVADSVIFSGSANYIAFDNITIGADFPVPEPWSLAVLGVGLIGVTLARRRPGGDELSSPKPPRRDLASF